MWLECSTSFGLIKPFSKLDLPSLAIIIGPNGAGKSQLLRGIAEGRIDSPFNPAHERRGTLATTNEAVLLTNNDPDPAGLTIELGTDLGTILRRPVRGSEAASIIKAALEQQIEERADISRQVLSRTGQSLEQLGLDWTEFAALVNPYTPPQPGISRDHLEDREFYVRLASEAGQRISAILQQYQPIGGGASPVPTAGPPSHLLSLDRGGFARLIGWAESSLFSPDLARIFLEYRDRRWRNQVQRQTDEEDGTEIALSTESFVTTFGRPPWERVTEALLAFGLPYHVAKPSADPGQNVGFKLLRNYSQQPLSFAELSTGERVLLRMVLASFQADDDRINVRPPSLILLDELDASLHPENVQRWLTAIQQGYVDGLGISCILTTHSPTTVALAPEDAIFEMSADDPRPVPISKQHAIDRLTTGLPMLAIDYSARRQVFTESTIDVDHYAMLHDLMRPRLDLKRTLSFVGTSTKGSCIFVYDMVDHMEANGNRAVFGIVDWDKKNAPKGHVRVLADGSHYAKDNVLLDPLLIGALLLKDDDLKLDPPVRYSDLRGATLETLQRISDAVVEQVKFAPAASGTLRSNCYWGGVELTVREAYQTRQGHELEAAIKIAFPMLGGRYRAEGQLISEIIQRVVADLPEYCPKPVTDLLIDLANSDE